MAIDIDSFLEKFDEKPQKIEKKKPYEVDLNFQKEIEDKLEHLKEGVQDEDYAILRKVYEEVKKFDEDLPNKFLGIEKRSAVTLKDLGEQYSGNYLARSKEQVGHITSHITGALTGIDQNLNQRNYVTLLRDLDSVKKLFTKFPVGFLKEKTQLENEIVTREVNIYSALENYKKTKGKEIEHKLADYTVQLNKLISSKSLKDVENKVEEVEHYVDRIPKILLSILTEDKMKVLQALSTANRHLESLYISEFENSKKELYVLFDKFQKSLLDKNLESCVVIYDEILLSFEKMPPVFIEQKVELYKHINTLYSSINSLVINTNVSLFLDAYKHSKSVDEIKDFLKTAKLTGSVNKETLAVIKDKIQSLPEHLKDDKEELKREIATLLTHKLQQTQNELREAKRDVNTKAIPGNPKALPLEKEINTLYNNMKKITDKGELDDSYNRVLELMKKVPLDKQQKASLITKIESVYSTKSKELS